MIWLADFVCPACDGPLGSVGVERQECRRCRRAFERVDGVWRFLLPEKRAGIDAFAEQFRRIREHEGRRSRSAAYYRRLPKVPAHDPHADDWRVRRETFHHLLGHVLAAGAQPSAILDLGAGSGWLSNRLAALGHHVVAVDAIGDDVDGLGVVRHYGHPVVAVQADFDALPLAGDQFDVVVFNGALHYAPDPLATLARARRMLRRGGTLVVMDSPMFRSDRDGAAMVADNVRRFAGDCGVRTVLQPGLGYLTYDGLDAAARQFALATAFVPSRGPMAWRIRRRLSRFRLGRPPAAFGLWMAR